jgi:hypothetical protein
MVLRQFIPLLPREEVPSRRSRKTLSLTIITGLLLPLLNKKILLLLVLLRVFYLWLVVAVLLILLG